MSGRSDETDRHLGAGALDETVSLALLDALEKLPAAERVAFVLRDVFGMEFTEIAETVGRTPTDCQQLVISARQDLASTRSWTAAALKTTIGKHPEES